MGFTAMSPAEVTEKLGLHRMKDRSWYVHPRYVIFTLLLLTLLSRLSSDISTVARRLEKGCLKDCNGSRVTSRTSRSKSRIPQTSSRLFFLYPPQLSFFAIPAFAPHTFWSSVPHIIARRKMTLHTRLATNANPEHKHLTLPNAAATECDLMQNSPHATFLTVNVENDVDFSNVFT